MKFLTDNLQKAGYINTTFAVLAIIFRISVFGRLEMINKIESVICIIALVFGLIYSLKGYRKDVAFYYKGFMILYSLSSFLSLSASIYEAVNGKNVLTNVVFAIIGAVVLICALMLAFGKDLGKGKSTNLSYIVLMAGTIKVLWNIVMGDSIIYSSASYAYLIQAFIVCVLVSQKYLDKKERGTK